MEEERQRVLAALSSAVEEIRYRAVQRLMAIYDEPPVEYLLQGLGDESWRVRKCVVENLVLAKPTADLMDALIHSLGDEDNAGLRNSASEVLLKIGSPTLPNLEKLVREGDKDERKIAADILGDIGDRAAVPALVKCLQDPDENVRAAAGEALGMLGDSSVAPHLAELLRQDGLVVQLSCLDALDRLEAIVPLAIAEQLLGTRPLRSHLYRIMARMTDPSVIPILMEGLSARGRVERAAAARALVRQYMKGERQKQVEMQVAVARASSDRIADSLRAMLESPAIDDQEAAARILGWTGRLDVVPDLIHAARDDLLREVIHESILLIGPKSAEVLHDLQDAMGRSEQVLAVDLLGHFGQASSLPWIIDLSLSGDLEVADAAQRSLAKIGGVSAIPTLISYIKRNFKDGARGVSSALVVLGNKHHHEVIEQILPMLDGTESGLRQVAADILCQVAHKTNLNIIIRLIGDEDAKVREAAVRAMGRVGGEEAVEKLRVALTDESPQVRATATKALGVREDPEVRKILKVALRDSEPWVVREALHALGQSGDEDIVETLLAYAWNPNGLVALEAVRAVNRIGWHGDVSWLIRAGRHPDPEVVKEVLAGSERWAIDDARKVLVEALGDRHWDVRMAAVKKIGEMNDPGAKQAVFEKLQTEEDELVKESMESILEVGKGNVLDD